MRDKGRLIALAQQGDEVLGVIALIDHELNDPDTRFNLQLATRAWATMHAMRGPQEFFGW